MGRRVIKRKGAAVVAAALLAALGGAGPAGLAGAASAAEGQWHGEWFPNVTLTDQDGAKHRFYDDLIKGKVVVINFIFTSCKDVCPMDTAQLRQLQAALGDRVGKDVFIYSISIDPKHDTPAVLKRYMKTFDVGPGWTFLTGSAADVALLQKKLGVAAATAGKLSDHDTRFIVGNEATGTWMKRSPHDHPMVLANLVGGYLHNGKPPEPVRPSYAEAGTIAVQAPGAGLFRTRCASCHTLGAQKAGAKASLGPDLTGVVERRPRAWLHAWIQAPDRMLAKKDPTAVALAKQWGDRPMPNLKLSDQDVDDLIAYLQEQSPKPVAARKSAPR